MKTAVTTAATLLALVLSTFPAVAEEPLAGKVTYLKLEQSPAAAASGKGSPQDEQLLLREAEFEKFAYGKIREMNANHMLSRARMQIRKGVDGSYRATFHEIDDQTLSCEVSRSASKSSPYVAVLSYRETVYAASCATPDECRRSAFLPVEVIPNRHIFTFSKGKWQ